MARTYKRDSNGRFAGGGGGSGGGGKSRPATKQLQRGTNRLTRDNAGRITSVGGSGATAYGGRIRTASGKRRATTVAKGIGKAPKGTVGKTRGMKPLRATTAKPDAAMVNIPIRGSRGRALDRDISRAAKEVKAAEMARLMKPKAQVKAERAARAETKRQAEAAKPKRVRSVESLRASRAKQIEKRRSITTNPAGERPAAAAKMAANAARTQQRAIAFLKARGKSSPSAMNQGRIKQFTDMKKVTDTEIRKVRQQIKDARSNATTFGAVPGLRLRLLELQSQSKRHRDTIASAKASTQK